MSQSINRYLDAALNVSAAVALVFFSLPAAALTPDGPQKVAANAPVVFAQTMSDLAVDPAARFGRLPNGMTYVIYKNATPPGSASVWMRVSAGSIMEQENQRGLAHFVEHMAFKGSKNVPEGEMIKLLERNGLQFGADTNAQTSHFQTVYMLNLPRATPRIVNDAMFLMRETASHINFKPEAIDSERGVILGEERSRSTVDSRAAEEEMAHILPGTKYIERMPIGLVDVIKTAQRPAFIQFYNDFYRPEYTTMIVVGDVNVDRIEADIRKRFSDWRPGPQSAAALTDFGKLTVRQAPQAKTFSAEGLTEVMSVYWAEQPADRVETKARYFDEEIFLIASAIVNKRFAHALNAPGTAFSEAALQRQDIQRTARLYALSVMPKPGQERAAFDQAMTIFREYLANGPTQAELDSLIVSEELRNRGGVARARTIPTQSIAGLILEALNSQSVIQSPAQGRAEFEAIKPKLTLAAINDALKQIKLTDSPALWRQGKPPATLDEKALLSAYRASMDAPVTSFAARTQIAWPYTQFGQPATVVSRQALPGVDATRVVFSNGATLTFKQTSFEDNAVHVSVQLGKGYLGLRPDQGAALFMAKQVGLQSGGLGKLSSDDIGEALVGKVFGLGFTIGNNATILSGSTTKTDLAVQMQVLTAFMTDPGFRPQALEQVRTGLPAAYEKSQTSPDGVYSLKASGNLYSGDPRFSTPTLSEALAVSNDSITALIKEQLGHGPADIAIVGDLTLDEAIRQVASTLGAVPALTPAPVIPDSNRLRFPTNDLHRVYTHAGRPDQNLSFIAWPTTDYYSDLKRAATLELLAAVMTLRELDEVRGKQAATYSVSASSAMSRYFGGFGYVSSRAAVRPEMDEAYFKTMSEIVDDLKQKPVKTDELMRARTPMIDHIHNDKSSNDYWFALLSGTVRDPQQIAAAHSREQRLLSVTPKDIQKAAQDYLDMSKAFRIQVKPESSSN